jgi:hypothetical protein
MYPGNGIIYDYKEKCETYLNGVDSDRLHTKLRVIQIWRSHSKAVKLEQASA